MSLGETQSKSAESSKQSSKPSKQSYNQSAIAVDYREGAPLYSDPHFANSQGCYVAKPTTSRSKAYGKSGLFHYESLLFYDGIFHKCADSFLSLNRNTFYKDSRGHDIYSQDIVHLVSKSLMNAVCGMVLFNPLRMAYEISIIHEGIALEWPKTIPLYGEQWEVIGTSLGGAIFEGKSFGLDYEQRTSLDICRPWDVTAQYSIEPLKNDKGKQAAVTQVYYQCKALVQKSGKVKEVIGYPLTYAEDPGTYYIYPAGLRQFTKSLITPIVPGSLRQCVLTSPTKPPIFEGDTLCYNDNRNIYGKLIYRPEKAQYCVQVSNDSLADGVNDDPLVKLFDDYFPLTREFIGPNGQVQWELLWSPI